MARQRTSPKEITTSVAVHGVWFSLRRDWLYGRRAWTVYRGEKHLGWVLQEEMVPHPRWGVVTPPKTEEEIYDDILYDFETRRQALWSLADE